MERDRLCKIAQFSCTKPTANCIQKFKYIHNKTSHLSKTKQTSSVVFFIITAAATVGAVDVAIFIIYNHTCIDTCVCMCLLQGKKCRQISGSALFSALYDNKAKAVLNCEMWRSITLDKNVPNQCACHAS
ncbi:conserved hypothetical protein [Trichinella spiralis]|uniref:hypothetical protein n=1 Tax=Trichinella spiralis TaxID=6334 RepID=UPI0001EFE749|nr:conserved hypothetical protein [Trichinella spiralis]